MIITGSSEGQIRNRHAPCEMSGGTAAAVGLWFHPLRTRQGPLPRAHYRKGGAQKKRETDMRVWNGSPTHPTVSSRGENARQTGKEEGTEENEHNVFTLGAALARARMDDALSLVSPSSAKSE